MQWHEFCINERVEVVALFVETGLTFLLASATRSLTKYSLIRDVTCLFGNNLTLLASVSRERANEKKRRGKTFCNFYLTKDTEILG